MQGNTDVSRQSSNKTSSFDDDDDEDDDGGDADANGNDAEESEQDEEDGEPRVLTEEEVQKRNEAYGTITRSQSELDLRAAAATPPPAQGRKNSLLSVQEEDDDDDDDGNGDAPTTAGQQQQQQPQQGQGPQNDSSGKGKKFSAKKMSLADLGLATPKYPTQFDDVDADEEDDGDAPGAFKRPKSAFTLAKTDLTSKDWQSEIEGTKL